MGSGDTPIMISPRSAPCIIQQRPNLQGVRWTLTTAPRDEATQGGAGAGGPGRGWEQSHAPLAAPLQRDVDMSLTLSHAEAVNERLLKDFPKGFALDKTHHPHISCLQRYVKTADLDKVY